MKTNNSELTIIDSSNYNLTRDIIMRESLPTQRFYYDGLGCYALNVANGFQNS